MKDKVRKTSKINKRMITKIISYIFVALIFSFTLTSLIFKFTNPDGSFYIFGSRYDVVLTDSMSEVNENYSEFLSDTEQIQPMSLVKSEKIDDDTSLDVYDVVLFNNPGIGTDMHRIVDIDDTGDYLTYSNAEITNINNKNLITLKDLNSSVETNFISFSSLEISVFSNTQYDNFFNLYFRLDISTEMSISCDKIEENLYHTTILFIRNTSAPTNFKLSFNRELDYSKVANIEYIKFNAKRGEFISNAENISLDEKSNNYFGNYNPELKYEIRGDKANTSDGWFKRNELYSKVISVTPRVGAYLRFFTSIYGIIAFTCLAVLIVVYDYLMDKEKEKKAKNE